MQCHKTSGRSHCPLRRCVRSMCVQHVNTCVSVCVQRVSDVSDIRTHARQCVSIVCPTCFRDVPRAFAAQFHCVSILLPLRLQCTSDVCPMCVRSPCAQCVNARVSKAGKVFKNTCIQNCRKFTLLSNPCHCLPEELWCSAQSMSIIR